MIAHIEEDMVKHTVKVYLWSESPQGRVFTWPVEIGDFGWVWYQYEVTEGSVVTEVKPALEFSWSIWGAFKEAILDGIGLTQDAKLLTETLKREQTRVDVLIHALIQHSQPSGLVEVTNDHQ